MLETLAGRLKWERTGTGIRVEIPARIPWLSALSGIGLLSFPLLTIELFDKLKGINRLASLTPLWIGIGIVILWFTLIFNIRQVITLNPVDMTFQTRILWICVKKGIFATNRLQCLRFVPSEYGLFLDDTSKIQIDKDFKTRNFAFGISELEADTLIEKMMEIYPFQK